jgi:hypothetical protein
VKDKHLFTSSHFSPNKFYLNIQIFSFDLKVLLYHGSRSLFTHFIFFLWPINYDWAFQCNKSSTHSLLIWFWFKIWFFSFPWKYGIVHGHVLRSPSRSNEWRITFGVISRFDTNVAFSWWRSRILRGACSSWSWTPSSLVLSYFSKLSHLGDLVTNWPYFWWWIWNCLWRLLRN